MSATPTTLACYSASIFCMFANYINAYAPLIGVIFVILTYFTTVFIHWKTLRNEKLERERLTRMWMENHQILQNLTKEKIRKQEEKDREDDVCPISNTNIIINEAKK